MDLAVTRTIARRPRWRRHLSKYVPRGIRYLLLILLAVLFAFPFYWVVLTSLEPQDHLYDFPPSFWPFWDWTNYADAWQAANWGKYFLNTAVICAGTTVLTLVTSVLAGYSFATMRFRGRRTLFAVIFTSIIMPPVVMIIPDYVLAVRYFHIFNTYWVQIIPFAAGTFGIFLLLQFFRGMPTELWDAARMDGCSRLRYLWSVAVPLSLPVLTTIGLFTFLASYNSLLWPLVMTNGYGGDPGVQPIEVGVYQFIGENGTHWNLLCAATVFTTLPVVILFLALQRVFVRGIMRTGLQG